MQFLKVDKSMKLTDLSEIVGFRNVDSVLHVNGVHRTPRIGDTFVQSTEKTIREYVGTMDPLNSDGSVNKDVVQKMNSILNTFTQDSDIFETAALLDPEGWKVLAARNIFPTMMRIPDGLQIPNSENVLGNGIPTGKLVYRNVMTQLSEYGRIDPGVFNEYSTTRPFRLIDDTQRADVFQWFKLPWGEVSLYSSISGDIMDFPVYPEDLSETTPANYTQMPELLYQYEPWQLYQSSGPRKVTFTFHFHRDMWTGDHRDGKANQLIRFCEANCFPEYNGSAVNVPTVTMYIKGNPMISGVMNDVSKDWSGPLGLDGFYLECKLSITITEIASQPLNYNTVRNLPLIG